MKKKKPDTLIINIVYDRVRDIMTIIYKQDGRKKLKIIKNPEYEFHILKPEFRDGERYLYVEDYMVDRYRVPYKYSEQSIAKILGKEQEYNIIKNSGQWRELRKFHNYPEVFGSLVDLEDWFIGEWIKEYGVSEQIPVIGYLDIEVDSYELGEFPIPERAAAPISHISYFNSSSKNLYTYILKNPKIKESDPSIIEKLKPMVKDKYQDEVNEINIEMYDDELAMITAFFNLINEVDKPDIVSIWNITYDIPYLMNRISRLCKVDFEDLPSTSENFYRFSQPARTIVTPKKLQDYQYVNFFIDRGTKDMADSGTYFKFNGFNIYIDQMLIHAAMNKSSKKESYNLDAIAEEELGDNKDKYDEDGNEYEMSTFMYIDYLKFTMYNIHDVMLLSMIEKKTNYIKIFTGVGTKTGTRFYKSFKKTICLENYFRRFLTEQNKILANNPNIYGDGGGAGFEGAYVGDPNNIENIGEELFNEE